MPEPAAADRGIGFELVFNVRDLGGLPTVDGRRVRTGHVFRADGVQRLAGADLERARSLRLTTVIDLRTEGEIQRGGRFPVEHYPVAWHHLPIIHRMWSDDDLVATSGAVDFLRDRYVEMLESGAASLARIIELVAAGPPALFHCAAGKDRTGLLAMLVLGTLGVSHDDIVEDYALTSATMDAFRAHAATDPRVAEGLANTPVMFFAADPAAMSRVLGDIEAAHGSVRSYVRTIGVDDDVIATLEANLLTD